MFPAIMYVLHLEKHKMQYKIKNQNIATEKQAFSYNPVDLIDKPEYPEE